MPSKEEVHDAFIAAIRHEDYAAMRECVDEARFCFIPEGSPRGFYLGIDKFIEELKRQRRAFPRISKESATITESNVTYLRLSCVMTATFSGRASSMVRDGYPVRRKGTKVEIVSDVLFTFTPAMKINFLVGESNPAAVGPARLIV